MIRRFAATLTLALLPTAAYAAPTKEECVAAYQSSQQLRRDGAFRGALELLLQCARDPCPAALQPDCVEWLREAQSSAPTIVVKAHHDGQDVQDVRVSMDGAEIATRLDGRAITVDTGEHRFVFERGGARPVERTLLVVEGEKARLVEVDIPGDSRVEVRVADPSTREQHPRWIPYALGGLGAVALGVFGTFGIMGLGERSDLAGCKPNCSVERMDSVGEKFLIADVSLAVGVVALAATAILLWTRADVVGPRAAQAPSPLRAR